MKVICDRGALVDALNTAGAAVVARTPKPVLTCIKLSATEGALTLDSTDLEVAIHLTIHQVEVAEPGEALVPADKLVSIVRESADPTLTIEADAEGAQITGADSHFKVFGYPVSEYPPVGEIAADVAFEIQAGELVDLINKTLFATARENSRYAINGVLMERDGKKLSMIATDGRRLAMARGSLSKSNGEGESVIVPTKALNLLGRLLDDPGEAVSVKIADNQAQFATERATLTTNLVEGNFPPYKDVLPKELDRKASFATDVLASGVRRAALLTNEESKGVKLAFAGDKLTLSSRAPEMGEAEVVVPIDSYTGDEIEIGFNPQFLTDVLKVVSSDQVTLELKAPNKPGTVKVGNDFLYVVMPISLS